MIGGLGECDGDGGGVLTPMSVLSGLRGRSYLPYYGMWKGLK